MSQPNRPKWTLMSTLILALTVALAPPTTTEAADAPADTSDGVDEAIAQAVDYLVQQQDEEGWINDRGRRNETAMTSLAILAMAAVGHQPADPTPQGEAMRTALTFVLGEDRQDDRGYFGRADGSRMYGHGITTLMLAEMLGQGVDAEQDRLIRRRCREAIGLTLYAQQVDKRTGHEGGWRYTPDSNDADLSVTVWQLMALRSAHNANMDVPRSAIDDAVRYLRNSYRSHERDEQGRPLDLNSGFGYQPGGGPTPSITAMGMLAMMLCGEYDAPEVEGAANYLADNPLSYNDRWFFYAAYYYAQSMHQRGGERAETARQLIESLLLEHQRDDGSWRATSGQENNAGRVYATSLAVLSLAVRHHYLPIYQR